MKTKIVKKRDVNTANLPITKRYANIKELSVYLGLSVKTLYEFANLQKIPSIKYGKKLLFDLQDIDKLMESLKRPHITSEETSNNIIGDVHGDNI
mgnify:CR=1 FL=1|jgi:excisionase family DNA binding protein